MSTIGSLWKRLIGGFRSAVDAVRPGRPDAAAPSSAPRRQCTICHTAVPPEADRCPLCGSTDVQTEDATSSDDSSPTPTMDRSSGTDDAVSKLAEVRREGGDLLVAYADRYAGVADGESKYEVTLADGSIERVADQQALKETLRREYGPPDAGDRGVE